MVVFWLLGGGDVGGAVVGAVCATFRTTPAFVVKMQLVNRGPAVPFDCDMLPDDHFAAVFAVGGCEGVVGFFGGGFSF